jgi:hypothetical protein
MTVEMQQESGNTAITHRRLLILKTNISGLHDINVVASLLDGNANVDRWNVDLQDVDHVLRIETIGITADEIIQTLTQAGYACEELPD